MWLTAWQRSTMFGIGSRGLPAFLRLVSAAQYVRNQAIITSFAELLETGIVMEVIFPESKHT